jgi:hypothetical protein
MTLHSKHRAPAAPIGKLRAMGMTGASPKRRSPSAKARKRKSGKAGKRRMTAKQRKFFGRKRK